MLSRCRFVLHGISLWLLFPVLFLLIPHFFSCETRRFDGLLAECHSNREEVTLFVVGHQKLTKYDHTEVDLWLPQDGASAAETVEFCYWYVLKICRFDGMHQPT